MDDFITPEILNSFGEEIEKNAKLKILKKILNKSMRMRTSPRSAFIGKRYKTPKRKDLLGGNFASKSKAPPKLGKDGKPIPSKLGKAGKMTKDVIVDLSTIGAVGLFGGAMQYPTQR